MSALIWWTPIAYLVVGLLAAARFAAQGRTGLAWLSLLFWPQVLLAAYAARE